MADKKAIRLPRSAAMIPKNGLYYPRPIRMWTRTEDFLKALDAAVRKNPLEGVSFEDACMLNDSLGGSREWQKVRQIILRTAPIHSLTIYRGRIRLSLQDLKEINVAAWKGRKTA